MVLLIRGSNLMHPLLCIGVLWRYIRLTLSWFKNSQCEQSVFQSHRLFLNLERVNLMKRHKTPLNNGGPLHLTPKTGGQVTPFLFMVMFGGQM